MLAMVLCVNAKETHSQMHVLALNDGYRDATYFWKRSATLFLELMRTAEKDKLFCLLVASELLELLLSSIFFDFSDVDPRIWTAKLPPVVR